MALIYKTSAAILAAVAVSRAKKNNNGVTLPFKIKPSSRIMPYF